MGIRPSPENGVCFATPFPLEVQWLMLALSNIGKFFLSQHLDFFLMEEINKDGYGRKNHNGLHKFQGKSKHQIDLVERTPRT